MTHDASHDDSKQVKYTTQIGDKGRKGKWLQIRSLHQMQFLKSSADQFLPNRLRFNILLLNEKDQQLNFDPFVEICVLPYHAS